MNNCDFKDATDEGQLTKDALEFAKALQSAPKVEEETEGTSNFASGRRNTVHHLMQSQSTKKTEETMNLDKRFKNRLQSISKYCELI